MGQHLYQVFLTSTADEWLKPRMLTSLQILRKLLVPQPLSSRLHLLQGSRAAVHSTTEVLGGPSLAEAWAGWPFTHRAEDNPLVLHMGLAGVGGGGTGRDGRCFWSHKLAWNKKGEGL